MNKRLDDLLNRWSPWRLRATLARAQGDAEHAKRTTTLAESNLRHAREQSAALRKELDDRLREDARRANPDAVSWRVAPPGCRRMSVPVPEPKAVVFTNDFLFEPPSFRARTADMQEYVVRFMFAPVELTRWGRPEIAAAVRRRVEQEAEKIGLMVARQTGGGVE